MPPIRNAGVIAHGVQRGGEHGRRRGLAVRARNGQRLLAHAQVGQHLRAVPDGHAAAPSPLSAPGCCPGWPWTPRPRRRCRPADCRRTGRCRPSRPHPSAGPCSGWTVRSDPLTLKPLVMRNMRDAAHAHAADADEMRLSGFLPVLHNHPGFLFSIRIKTLYRHYIAGLPRLTQHLPNCPLHRAVPNFAPASCHAARARPGPGSMRNSLSANSGPSTLSSGTMYAAAGLNVFSRVHGLMVRSGIRERHEQRGNLHGRRSRPATWLPRATRRRPLRPCVSPMRSW